MKKNLPEPQSDLERAMLTRMKDGMTRYIHDHPECVTEALNLAVSDRQPYAWRAAWLLTNVIGENDVQVRPYVKKMLRALNGKDDGHLRELLKILVMMELNDDQEGRLFDKCVGLWKIASKPPAIRYTAFRFIHKMTKKYPELLNEVKLLTGKEYLETLSPGVKHSVGKMMEELLE